MRLFRVRVAGTGLRKTFGGETGTYGFYANRFVTAESAVEAETMAISSIATREDLRDQLAASADAPSIIVEETVEWNKPVPGAEQQGLVWYPEPGT